VCVANNPYEDETFLLIKPFAFMVIKTKLTVNDFIKVNFILLFRRPIFFIVFGIMVISLILGIASALFSSTALGEFSLSRILTPLIVLTILPAMTYFIARKNYTSNKRISEVIEYNFGKDYLTVTGESFKSELTWDKVYRVTQFKKWILIYQSKQIANVIHRCDVWDGAMQDLKQILTDKQVKNNL